MKMLDHLDRSYISAYSFAASCFRRRERTTRWDDMRELAARRAKWYEDEVERIRSSPKGRKV